MFQKTYVWVKNNYDQALKYLQQALNLKPDYKEALKALKLVEDRLKQKEEQKQKKKARFTELYKKGAELLNQGDYFRSIKYMEAARKLSPSRSRIKTALIMAYKKLAQQYLEKKDYTNSFKTLKKARALNPRDTTLRKMQVLTLNGLSQAYFDKGAYGKVISVSTQTLKLADANAQAHILLGKAYYETEQIEKAVSEFKIVVKLQPDNEEIKKLLNVSKIEKVTVEDMGLWKSDYFIIDFDSEDEQQKELVKAVLIALENTYENIGKDLHFYPDTKGTKTKVSIYSREEYAKLKGMVEWSIGRYKPDTKEILISLFDMKEQPKEQILSTLWHETTHLFIDLLTKGNCPLWLDEGFAVYQENKKAKVKRSWKPIKKAVQKGNLYTLKELEGSFNKMKDKDKVALAYSQSLAAVEYIISEYDLRGLRKIFKQLGQGRAINEALIIGTKSDYNNLERNYKNYLKKEYSSGKKNKK